MQIGATGVGGRLLDAPTAGLYAIGPSLISRRAAPRAELLDCQSTRAASCLLHPREQPHSRRPAHSPERVGALDSRQAPGGSAGGARLPATELPLRIYATPELRALQANWGHDVSDCF